MLRVRKNLNSLTVQEKADLITAIKALKANGKYDQYVNEHSAAMDQPTPMPGETPDSNVRNIAHRGPAFGPWHREFLRRFELDLQAEVPGVTLPYWDWSADSQLADPKNAAVWQGDLMGPDGDPNNQFLLGAGPFKFDANDPNTWRVVTGLGEPGPGLRRAMGRDSAGNTLPTPSDVTSTLGITPYDKSRWTTSSDPSFRNRLEGFLGPQQVNMHNRVHVWVGGSMGPGTSPNDPVFFLHHCNVDRLWWQWQLNFPDEGYLPVSGGPPGHNLNDQMQPWDAATTPASVLDIHKLGYRYDTDPPQSLSLIIERSTFGQDEIAAAHPSAGNPALIDPALWVAVDGFTAAELGLTAANLSNPPSLPNVALSPALSEMSLQFVGPVIPEDPSLPPTPQRFRYQFRASFTGTADFGFAQDFEIVKVSASLTVGGDTVAAAGLFELVKQANPFLLDGPTSWLSVDVRVFKLRAGDSRFGIPMGFDAPGYITSVINALNAGNGSSGPDTFDGLPADEAASSLELVPTDIFGIPVYNFALARVHMRGLTTDATETRVFFRLFQAQSTTAEFEPSSTYRRFSDGTPGGHTIPLLGISGGEYVTIPCFAAPRIDSANASMTTQFDAPNVRTIVHDPGGAEVQAYYGCWLDTNQPGRNVLPATPGAAPDGPFPAGSTISVQQAIVRSPHQCLVAEIAFDPTPIPTGVDPSTSDKLAQRNIAWVSIPNPGLGASRVAPQPFELRATGIGAQPDELMIDWGGLPAGSTAQIYLPSVSADEVRALAAHRGSAPRLSRVDEHTLSCSAETVTYVPIPPGPGATHAGLLSVQLPIGVRRGELFTVLVRQVTPMGFEDRRAGRFRDAARRAPVPHWKRVNGAFQVNVPVHTKAVLLPGEERVLAVLRWIGGAIPISSRWYPVFARYLDQIAGRVDALGGDPTTIEPSPTGGSCPHEPGAGAGATGKVIGIIYDRFGDFAGFILETEHGAERHFRAREHEIEELIEQAWSQRAVITVHTDPHRPEQCAGIVLRRAPKPFQH